MELKRPAVRSEQTWEETLFETWGPRSQLAVRFVTCISCMFAFIDTFLRETEAFKVLSGYFAGFLPERSVYGDGGANCFVALTVLWTLCVCWVAHSPRFNAKNYTSIVVVFGAGLQLAYSVPAHIEYLRELFGVKPECSAATTISAAATIVAGGDERLHVILRRAAYHVGIQMVGLMAVALFVPEPKKAALVMLLSGGNNALRAQFLWRRNYGIDLFAATWPFHLTTFGIALAVCNMAAQMQHESFRIRVRLRELNDSRIEQLQREKERLDYERAFALKRSGEGGSPSGLPGGMPPLGLLGSKETNSNESANGGGGSPTRSPTRTRPLSECSAIWSGGGLETPLAMEDVEEAAAIALAKVPSPPKLPGGAPAAGCHVCVPEELPAWRGVQSVSSAASNSEIDLLLSQPASTPAAPQTGSPEPLYQLQPQYFAEERDGAFVWLSGPEQRAAYLLHVHRARLCDAEGRVLAPSQPTSFIFVIDGHGDLLAARKPETEPACLRHSSLVAGAAVAAAGEMVVHAGALLSISNWSGHYAPPPSTLGLVLNRLARLGMLDLKDVKLEVVGHQGHGGRSLTSDDRSDVTSEVCWDPALALKS